METLKGYYAPDPSEQQLRYRDLLLGKWHGKAPVADGGTYEWLMHRHPNGEYTARFVKTNAKGKALITQTKGLWGVSGDIYFSIEQSTHYEDGGIYTPPPGRPTNYNAYHILSLTETDFQYQHAGTQHTFEIKKVADDFVL